MIRAAVLGKGGLALHACGVVASIDGWQLSTVLVNQEEPGWDVYLSDNVRDRWPYADVRTSGDWSELVDGQYDLVVSVSYDRIIGRDLIHACGRILNCHLGPLPRYRGMRPINWALKNGEVAHGVTIHEIVEEVDAGPIVAQVEFPIWPEIDEVRDVWERATAYGKLLLTDTLPRLDRIRAVPQDDSVATIYYGSASPRLGDRQSWTRAGTTE